MNTTDSLMNDDTIDGRDIRDRIEELEAVTNIAAAFGANSAARAADGGFIVLAQYDEDTVVAVKTAQVGKDGIKPDTWYKLSPTGESVEAE